jgi:hypothetical protein
MMRANSTLSQRLSSITPHEAVLERTLIKEPSSSPSPSQPEHEQPSSLPLSLSQTPTPLHVEELAEVLAVDFADGIPHLKPSWRWEDHEQAFFTSCSSLIAVVDTGGSRVVQFSHFSVKRIFDFDAPHYFKSRCLKISHHP